MDRRSRDGMAAGVAKNVAGDSELRTVQVYYRGSADTVDVTQMPTPQTCNQFGKTLIHQPKKVRAIKETKKAAINF